MISFDRFERSLPALLDDLAAPRLPDYAEDLFARTAATRQRPEWTFIERWIPMSAISRRFAAVPRIPWRLGALVALLAVLALVATIVAGSFFNPRPSPYGPAANGRIAYVNGTGNIVVGDPLSGASTTIVATRGNSTPLFSQDGSRVAFLHAQAGGNVDVMVASADGTGATTVSDVPIAAPQYVGWSPDGRQLLVLDGGSRLLLYDATTTAAPTWLSLELDLRVVGIGPGYNHRSSAAFRPPDGKEILLVAGLDEQSLIAARTDGTGYRTLIDPAASSLGYSGLRATEWSPDGSKVVFQLQVKDHPDIWHTYLVDADGTNVRPLSDLSTSLLEDQNSPLWSPDGTRIAFQYWSRHAADDGQDFHGIGVVDVATGELTDVGPVLINGASWGWSPDGKSILEIPGDGGGEVLIIDATTGVAGTAPWTVSDSVDWQRVAP